MKDSKYLLTVKGSKAIHAAKIGLDSITVLSGVNACGKSTLARILHQIVNLSSMYPVLLERHAWKPVKTWASQIVQLKDRLDGKGLMIVLVSQDSLGQMRSRLTAYIRAGQLPPTEFMCPHDFWKRLSVSDSAGSVVCKLKHDQ